MLSFIGVNHLTNIRMKKFAFAGLISILAMVSLSGCNGTEEVQEPADETPVVEETVVEETPVVEEEVVEEEAVVEEVVEEEVVEPVVE